jgi:hypothetical protein
MIYPFRYSWTAAIAPRWTSSCVEAVPNEIAINCPWWMSKQRFLVHAVENGLLRVLHRASSGIVYFRRRWKTCRRFLLGNREAKCHYLAHLLYVAGNSWIKTIGDSTAGKYFIWNPFYPNPFWLLHNNRQGIQVATLAETTRITMQLPPERLLELWCEWCSRTCRLSIVQGACWHVMDGVVLIANKSNSTDLCVEMTTFAYEMSK